MKKLLLALLVLLGLQTKAQINYCDSISYATSTGLNYPFGISGVADFSDTTTWSWTVCNSTMCYSATGQNAYFSQVSLTDTLKVCYDAVIKVNGMTYVCTGCDTLVYNPNSYQWKVVASHPLEITELKPNTIDDGKMYDLLGREIFEIPRGIVYIKNGKKFIR